MADPFDAASWEARYRSRQVHGTPSVNPQLVAEAETLAPGTALDAGCGEGANAVWLAARGWSVTAADVSPTALARARKHADCHGTDVARRVAWLQEDLTAWTLPRARFDLVTAFYVHPAGSRSGLLERLADAVAPGGTLIVVDHDPSDEHAHVHASAGELRAALAADSWDVEVAETRPRTETGQEHGHGHGHGLTFRDVVLRTRRRR
jgi:2-polyprenyl-3-methyl-5-hydroxy-6-metoxy-1,4-benzoquinol methylase